MANGSLNKVILIGNLGTDVEVKHFENGGSLARFPIATSESYTNRNGEQVTQTEWHNIVVRGGLVDVVSKYLKKGDKVYVEGRIRTRSWQDASTKETRYTTEIMTDNFLMLGGKPTTAANDQPAGNAQQGQADQNQASNAGSFQASSDEQEDDLPF